jgi:hypothetical protein
MPRDRRIYDDERPIRSRRHEQKQKVPLPLLLGAAGVLAVVLILGVVGGVWMLTKGKGGDQNAGGAPGKTPADVRPGGEEAPSPLAATQADWTLDDLVAALDAKGLRHGRHKVILEGPEFRGSLYMHPNDVLRAGPGNEHADWVLGKDYVEVAKLSSARRVTQFIADFPYKNMEYTTWGLFVFYAIPTQNSKKFIAAIDAAIKKN